MLDAGVGLAMGQMMGNMMGQQSPAPNTAAGGPPPPPMAMTYHYNGTGGQGQFTAQQIAQHVTANRKGTHNVWANGWSSWQSWQQVPEIANLIPPAPMAPPPLASEKYHYSEDGENKGEQSIGEIAQSVQANPDGNHLVWKNGMSAWTATSEVSAIQSLLQSAPPPLPSAGGGPPPLP